MKSNNLLLLLLLALAAGCSSSGSSGTPPPTLVRIAVSPPSQSLAAGVVLQYTAIGVYSNGSSQALTSAVAWNSSDTAVATISNAPGSNGIAAAVAPGAATITASSGGITSNAAALTVTAAKLVSISVTPAGASIPTGATLQYTAVGTYSNTVTSDITASVTWSSSDSNVAMINAAGLATTPSATVVAPTATATITAALGAASGSTTLVVTGGTAAPVTNVMAITVNGSLCSAATSTGYLNKPCVSVTICVPGTSTCEPVNDILLDTGSWGLRIFKQAFSASLVNSLTPVLSGSGQLGNCVQFADGSADWGPVYRADVVLGGEKAPNVPIQIIDATFGAVPSSCGTPDLNPEAAGLTGILGVGVFAQDCGTGCVPDPRNPGNANNGIYYSCSGTTCTGAAVPLSDQVTNPVVSLPTDSNGVIVQLPSVATSGTTSVDGILVLGIDTRTNNRSTGAVRYVADQVGQIATVFNGTSYAAIVDSGSNGLFFTPPSGGLLPNCSSGPNSASWFCPSVLTNLTATIEGSSGASHNDVMFQIGNFTDLTSGSNLVFPDIGGGVPAIADIFDWGLPFYFGRNVYVGFESPSGSGTGQYFAY